MSSPSRRPLHDILQDVNELAQDVIDHVLAVLTGGGDRRRLEQTVLRGVAVASEGIEQLSHQLEAARLSKQDVEPISEAITQVEQKLAFFQGCTMRRSSAFEEDEEEAEAYASDAERRAESARASAALYQLVEAYKATEGLEARIIELRDAAKSGTGPEPRILDLPRARVLVARRAIGAAVRELDAEDD